MKPISTCPDITAINIFTQDFVDDFNEELNRFNAANDHQKEIALGQLNYELEMLSIMNFYVNNIFCATFMGVATDHRSSGGFFVHQLIPGDFLQFSPLYSMAEVNVVIPLGNQDYSGGGFKFLRYNCSIEEVPAGQILMFPGDLTHSYTNHPVIDGVFTFLSMKLGHTYFMCYLDMHGKTEGTKTDYVCPGFEKYFEEK